MGYKKFEMKITFVVDDCVEEMMDQIKEMKNGIESGTFQRQFLELKGITNIKSTFKQLNKE